MSAFDTSLPVKQLPRTAEALRPSFYTAFTIYYCVFVGFGMTAAALGAATIRAESPDFFSVVWGPLIAVVGALAATGVVLSYRRKKPWMEVIGTSLLIGLMFGYVVAIVLHAIVTLQDISRVAGAWVPILAAVFPVMRILWIANTPDALFSRKPVPEAA